MYPPISTLGLQKVTLYTTSPYTSSWDYEAHLRVAGTFQSRCLCPVLAPLCVHFTIPTSITTPTRWPPHCAFSSMAHHHGDLFDYTSGRWKASYMLFYHGICLTHNPTCSALMMSFATQSADVSSTLMG